LQLASARALVPLLRYLRGLGVAPAAASREAPTPAGTLLERYAEYLLIRQGLAAETVRGYCNTARAFLADRERVAGDLALGALDVAAINDYLLGRSRRGSISSSKAVVTGLRSLLRFLHVEGLIDRDLAVTVAPVANWRLASLVKALDAASVARLLDSCDRGTAVGRRDLAILLLLSRLGLRIGEVAALRLDDLDWRAGEFVVCGKGNRQERLPLPVDVGDAVAAWLKDGRPDCQNRYVFTRARAPHDGLHPSALTSVVHRACRRAGLPRVGAHRLRHTAATEMLRAGGSLREVGQVLRHRSSEVTSIYAKVDRRALSAVVRPWPEAAA
jgi:integrase/recombinase XerD